MAKIYRFFFFITKNKNISVYLFSLVFLPGTFIHEVSHFIAALFLLVPVGEVKLIPEITPNNLIKMGQVPIAKTDIVRRFLIGIAPFVLGVALLLLTVYFWSVNNQAFIWWKDILTVYIVFEIGNTMFSSKKDMEGAVEMLLVILFLGLIIYATGINIPAVFTFLPEMFFTNFFKVFADASGFLVIPVATDLLILLIFHLLEKYSKIKL